MQDSEHHATVDHARGQATGTVTRPETLTARARHKWDTRMTPHGDHAERGSADTGCMEGAPPTTIMTTFYDLIVAIHAVVEPDAVDFAVPVIMHLLESGRITFLGDVEELTGEVLGDCGVHNIIPPTIFPPSSGILPESNR